MDKLLILAKKMPPVIRERVFTETNHMGIVNTTMLYDGNFDFMKVTADDVVFGFVVRMPFRFRVSSPYHCHFENRGADYDIWIKNTPIPPTESGIPLHGLIRAGGSVEDLWSRVVIIPNKCGVTDAEIDALRQGGGNLDSASIESRNKQLFPAMQALNAFHHWISHRNRGIVWWTSIATHDRA